MDYFFDPSFDALDGTGDPDGNDPSPESVQDMLDWQADDVLDSDHQLLSAGFSSTPAIEPHEIDLYCESHLGWMNQNQPIDDLSPNDQAPYVRMDHSVLSHELHQALVQSSTGESSAIIGQFSEFDSLGTLSVIGTKHSIIGAETGDFLDVQLADGSYVCAELTDIHADHDTFRAEIDPSTIRAQIDPELSSALTENLGESLVFSEKASIGSAVEFHQIAGLDSPQLRSGIVSNVDFSQDNFSICNSGGTGGSSGSPVINDDGDIIGRVVAFDEATGDNLVVTTDQLVNDLNDFALGQNTEQVAQPIEYGDDLKPVMSYAEEMDRKAASGRLGPAGGHCNEGHDSSGNPRGA